MELTEFSLERVDHSGMQATHERELDLIARVAHQIDGAVAGEQAQFALDGLLAELLEHTEAHFVEEERLIARYPFPPAAAHAAEHERAIGLLRQIIDGWRYDRDVDALRDDLLNRHLAWMRRHVSTMDYLTAQFIGMAEVEHLVPGGATFHQIAGSELAVDRQIEQSEFPESVSRSEHDSD